MTCRRVPWIKHDTLIVSPCVAGNQDADNLHGDNLHGDDLHGQGRRGERHLRGTAGSHSVRKSADGEPER